MQQRHFRHCLFALCFCSTLILALAWAAPCAADDPIQSVVVTGSAAVQDGNLDGARQNAIQDALRQAIEQGLGMVMDATAIVQDDVLMEKIHSHTAGHITDYSVLNERENPPGLYRVRIQAQVNTGDITNLLHQMGIIKPMMDYPRVMLLPFPDTVGQADTRVAEAAFIKGLTQNKFDVVDPDQSHKLHGDIRQLFQGEGINQAAARIGLEHQAEIVILYDIKHVSREFTGIGEQVQTSCTTRTIVTTTAQILTADTVNAAGVGNSQQIARQNSVMQAAERNCRVTMDAVLAWWTDYTANGTPYIITLQTGPRAARQVLAFQDALSSIPGVVSVSERSSGGGITQMMVKYKFDSIELRRGILDRLERRSGFENLDIPLSKGRFMVVSTN